MRSCIWLLGVLTLSALPRTGSSQELQRRHEFKAFDQWLNQVVLSADGKTLAAAMRGVDTKTSKRWTDFIIWDTTSHQKRHAFQTLTEDLSVIALSPDGALLIAANYQGKTLLWSVKDEREHKFVDLDGDTPTLAFSADGMKLASATREAILIASANGDNRQRVPFRGRYGHRAFSPDLRVLAAANHQDVDLFDAATGKLDGVLPDHPGSVSHIAFSGDGKTVAVIVTMVDEAGYDSLIVVWDVAKRTERTRLRGLGYCRSTTLNHDGKYLLVIADKAFRNELHELKAVEIGSGKVTSSVRFARGQAPHAHAQSRDGKLVAVGCHDGSVHLFDVK